MRPWVQIPPGTGLFLNFSSLHLYLIIVSWNRAREEFTTPLIFPIKMLSCATKGKPSLAMYIDLAKTLLYCYLSSLIRHETVLFGAKLINQSALFPRLCSSNRDYSWKWFILQTWSWASPSWSTLPLTLKSLFAPTTVNKTETWAPRTESEWKWHKPSSVS